MTYLFGDSSPSDLQIDYIEFLRDALDFAVQVLGADERMRAGAARAIELRLQADAEVARLEALGAAQARAIEGFDIGAEDSATAQCAQTLLRGAADAVRAAVEGVRAAANSAVAKIEDEARRDRERCAEALGAFLVRHDLPAMSSELRLQQEGGSRYVARLYARALDDLQAALDLDIPSAHLLAGVARVDKLIERLEVHAPETGGWLRKEVKLRAQRLDKEFITAVVANARETVIHLRTAADGSGVGFDLTIGESGGSVVLRRAGEGTELPPFELDDTDSGKVRELKDKLRAAMGELKSGRRTMVEAQLGDTPLGQHTDPKVVVERLVAAMAPVVREIAKRSLAPTELVLKRQLGDGRREEIFVSRRDLQEKLRGLGAPSRAVFKPLELGELPPDPADKPAAAATASPAISSAPKPAPAAAAPAKAAEAKAPEAKAPDNRTPAAGVAALPDKKPSDKSLFASALAVDKVRPTAPPPPAKDDAVALRDDSVDRLIVSETTVRKPD